MAANFTDRAVFNVPLSLLQALIRESRFSSQLNIVMKSENPMAGGVWYRFHHGATFTSYGEKITITLTVQNAYSTIVDVHSECGMPSQIIDWGKNKCNCEAVMNYIRCNITRFSVASANNYAPTHKYCIHCGTPISINSRFCSKCGSRVA